MIKTRTSFGLLLGAILLLGLSGCGPRLNNQQTLELGLSEIRTILIDPSNVAQDVRVSAKTDGVNISVYVYLSENDDEVSQAIERGDVSAKIIASATGSDINLTASVPANKEASVLMKSADAKSTTVEFSLSN